MFVYLISIDFLYCFGELIVVDGIGFLVYQVVFFLL